MPAVAGSKVSSGKAISRLGVGCSRIGSFNNRTPLAETRAMLEAALAAGITVFDTASIYGQGDSERELGRLLKGRADRAFVVTKIGKLFSAKMRLARPFKPLIKALLPAQGRQAVTAAREGQMDADFAPAGFAAKLEGCLSRLRMDAVDGLLLHSPPRSVIEDPATAEALAALKQRGLIGEWGVSVDTLDELRAAAALPGLALLQIPYDVIEALSGDPLEIALGARGVTVFAREVIRFQPALAPARAAARAAALPLVDCVIVGASTRAHLGDLAAAVGEN
jgi:aryl-alcohol dehydrogenase-like predicted oxidoreductase